jgi:hypothetical protein
VGEVRGPVLVDEERVHPEVEELAVGHIARAARQVQDVKLDLLREVDLHVAHDQQRGLRGRVRVQTGVEAQEGGKGLVLAFESGCELVLLLYLQLNVDPSVSAFHQVDVGAERSNRRLPHLELETVLCRK